MILRIFSILLLVLMQVNTACAFIVINPINPETLIEREENTVKQFYESYKRIRQSDQEILQNIRKVCEVSDDYMSKYKCKNVNEEGLNHIRQIAENFRSRKDRAAIDKDIFSSEDSYDYFGAFAQINAIRFFTAITVGDFDASLKKKAINALQAIKEERSDSSAIVINTYKDIIAAINTTKDEEQLYYLMGDLRHDSSTVICTNNYINWHCCDNNPNEDDICKYFPYYNDILYVQKNFLALEHYLKYFSKINSLMDVLRALKLHDVRKIGVNILPDTYRMFGNKLVAQDMFYKITRGNKVTIKYNDKNEKYKIVSLDDKTTIKYISSPYTLDSIIEVNSPGKEGASFIKYYFNSIRKVNPPERETGFIIKLLFDRAIVSDDIIKDVNNQWLELEKKIQEKIDPNNIKSTDLEIARIEKEVVEFVKEQALPKLITPGSLKDVITTLTKAEFIESNLEKLRQYTNGEEFLRQDFSKVMEGQMPVLDNQGNIEFLAPIEDTDILTPDEADIDIPYSIDNLDDEKENIIAARREAVTDEGGLEIEGAVEGNYVTTFDNFIGILLHINKFINAFLPGMLGKCIPLPYGIPCNAQNDIGEPSKTSKLKDPNNVKVTRKPGWKVGEDYNKPLANGKSPSWNTIKNRFWKNKANNLTPDKAGELEALRPGNVERMRQGKPPQKYNRKKFKKYGDGWESKELHHDPIPKRDGGKIVEDLWPEEHAAKDPFRRLGY